MPSQEGSVSPMEKAATSSSWKYALFLVAVVVLVYAPSFRFPFMVLDDTQFIVRNPVAHDWSALPSYFTGVQSATAKQGVQKIPNLYRPLPAIWVLIDYSVLGLRPGLWHLVDVLAYAAGVLLLWGIARKLTGNDFVALVAALLYGLHPMHVEGVTWLSGASVEMVLDVFFLGGFLAYLHWRETGKPAWLATVSTLTLCALLSKETAIALPVLICAHALIFPRLEAKTSRRAIVPILAMVATVAVYFLVRSLAIHGVVAPHPQHSWGDVVRTAPLLFVTYLQHALWPAHLGTWYDTPVVRSVSDPKFYLPLIVCAAYALVTVWALVRRWVSGFFLLWWVVGLAAPVIGVLAFPDHEILHDRFAFLALAGLCMAASALVRLPSRGQSLYGFNATSVVVMAVVMVVLGALTIAQVETWSNDIVMYTHAAEVSPRSVRPRLLLANEWLKRNRLDQALALDRAALAIDPERWETLFAYGVTLDASGNRPEALRVLAHAAQAAPEQDVIYDVWAGLLAESGDLDGAGKILEKGINAAESPAALKYELERLNAARRGAVTR